ncbi:hypothetical protein [Formosimonas limnophila]|nr:hypothetical protein [Formosimonas limnophila]
MYITIERDVIERDSSQADQKRFECLPDCSTVIAGLTRNLRN